MGNFIKIFLLPESTNSIEMICSVNDPLMVLLKVVFQYQSDIQDAPPQLDLL